MSASAAEELMEFLLARIAEDESVAHYALSRDGELPTDKDWGGWWLGHYQHYHRHDPARVLVECESKREIVTQVDDLRPEGGEMIWCLLAAPYADHPDYRDEWRP